MRNRWVGVAATAAAASLIMLAPPAANALKYSGYLGTTVYGFNTVAPDEVHADTFVPVRFRVGEELSLGEIGFVGSGRMYTDIAGDGGANGRVYHGYLEWQSPGDWLEVDLGRQYIAAGTTASTLDGVRALVKSGKKWRADLYGGSTVAPDFGAMRRFSRAPVDEPYDVQDRGFWLDHYTYGAHGGTNVNELWAKMPFPMWVGVGGSLSKRNGHISETALGVDLTEDPLKDVKATQEVQFDYLGRRVDYQYYSVRYRPWKALRTYVDYRWTEPRFDYASVFSVFAREGRHRARVGGQYKVSEIIQPFADYSASIRGENLSHRVQAGLEQNFEYAFLRYGAVYGLGKRSLSGGDEIGGFAAVDFPKPIPSFERLSAGASLDYLSYKGFATPAPDWEKVALLDVFGRLRLWRFLEATVGGEGLKNPDRKFEVRAYLQANAAVSG
jgi:hypothetical protein